jgi:GTP cyclohydrolase I
VLIGAWHQFMTTREVHERGVAMFTSTMLDAFSKAP